jgi:DNA polymerase-4
VRIFREYTDQLEVYSVDEAFLDFSRNPEFNSGSNHNDPESSSGLRRLLLIGIEIKRRIGQEVGEWLTCSVGIAQNKFLAKLAADLQKPDGLSVVWRENLPEIYRSKNLNDLWGINHGWTKRLERLGITNPAQLLNYPVQNLIAVFGKPGFFLWQRVNGLEVDAITDYGLQITDPKSFGNSWVLNFRTTDKERLKIVVLRLAEKAARRMRAEGFIASGMYLSVLLVDGNYFRQSKKLSFRIATGMEAYEQALKIWQAWKFKQNVLHIGVGFTYLSIKTSQQALFPDKFSSLVPVLDNINDKYGEFTIRSGLLAKTRDFAPDAIAFGK